MNVTCPSCKTRYSVDDARVPPSGVTIKCPNCGHTFVAKPPRARSTVALPGSVAPPSASAPPAAPTAGREPRTTVQPRTQQPGAVPLPGTKAPNTEGPVPLPASHPPPPPAGPRAGSAVALPGSVESPPSLGGPRAGSAVALPGSSDPIDRAPSRGASASTEMGELDLGLEDDVPLPAPKHPAPGPMAFSSPADQAGDLALGGDEVLDFIGDRAGGGPDQGPSHHPEFKIRRRNGRVEGPYGVGRIQAMLRNQELQGSEDISTDGVSWRAMTAHPELNATLNEMHAADDPMAFGNVDLPPLSSSTDLPISASLPGPRPTRSSSSLDLTSADLGTDSLGSPYRAHPAGQPAAMQAPEPGYAGPSYPPTGAEGPLPNAPSAGFGYAQQPAPGQEFAPSALDPRAFPPASPAGAPAADAMGLEASSRDLAHELQVGEVPELPPIWQTYRNHIIAFCVAIALVLLGVYTQFFTPFGAFGIPALVEVITATEPPDAPEPPPPPPAKLADPKEVASLIDEHSYESFRSVFATLQQAGPTVPDNQLALARARGFATLAYGPEVFPLEALAAAVEALSSLDLNQAMGGDADAANVAIAKARTALQLLAGEPELASNQLLGLIEAHPDDKELALLLGTARMKLGQPAAAVAAYDRALIADAAYAPALHAFGEAVEAIGGPQAAEQAAIWYSKALEANPRHSRSGLAAARLYEALNKSGLHRTILKKTAAEANRGLPPDELPPFLYRVAKTFDEQGRLGDVAEHAIEAARLQPGDAEMVGLGAVATALSGDGERAIAMLAPVLKRDPQNVDATVALARVYVKTDDIAKGFIELEKARKVAGSDSRIPLWEARFHISLGKFNDAQLALRRAVRLAGNDPMPYVEQGQLELKLGDINAAYESAQAAVKAAPTEARAHGLLAACYARRGQLRKAEKSFERAIALDGEQLRFQLGYANALRDQAAKRANPQDSKTLARAVPIYLKALRKQPNNPQVLFEYGRVLELLGDLRGALALYEDAAELDAQDVRPHLKMVSAYLDPANRDMSAARSSMKQARLIEGIGGVAMPEVRFWEARIAYDEGKPREAVNAMRTAIEAVPTNPIYQYWMGRVLEADNSLYEAITHYKKAVKLNSRYAPAIRALGRASLELKRFDQARKYYRQYQRAAPEDHTVHVEIGDSYTMQNRDDEAAKAYKAALAKMPDTSRALLQLGNISDRRGKSSEALRYYRRAARADPDLGEAVCKVALIEAQGRLDSRTRRQLERCVELRSSPTDLQMNAREILQTPAP